MRILLAGQKYFGAAVFRKLKSMPGVEIAAVSAPLEDRLTESAALNDIPVITSGTLREATMPEGIDLIVAAHSHDFIGERTRLRATYGGIGFHPSLLPVHRGRDAIRWAIRMGDKITGGTVYRLSNRVDGGNIILQKPVFIKPNDTARELWNRELAPLGIELLAEAVEMFRDQGFIQGVEQDEDVATWEPSIDRPPLFKPDLLLLPGSSGGT